MSMKAKEAAEMPQGQMDPDLEHREKQRAQRKQAEREKMAGKKRGGPPPGHGPHGALNNERARDPKKVFKRLLVYLRPELPKICAVFACAILATLFNIIAPKELGNATTEVYNGAVEILQGVPGGGVDFDVLLRILTIVLGLYLCYSLFSYLQSFIMCRVTQNVVYRLRQDTEEKLNRLPLSFYDRNSKGEILSRVVNDIDLISSTLQECLAQTITAVISLVGIAIMMFSISWKLTLVVLISLPLSAILAARIAKFSQKYYLAQQDYMGDIDAHIEETYGGHTEVRAFAHEDSAIETFEGLNEHYFQSAFKAQFVTAVVRPLTTIVSDLVYIFICAFGGYLAIIGSIQVGDIQAFIQYARNFSTPITTLASILNTVQGTLAAGERVFEVHDELELADESDKPAFNDEIEGHVTFDQVRFGYVEGKTIIRNLSVDVTPGMTVAIVGPTGAGKTTLVNLLMRFYEINGGAIRVDGVDTSAMSRKDLRKHFGMVLQDTWLFKGTIRDNIAYGVDEASDEQIIEAAKAAHAHSFISALPDGYDTVINEEASNVSAGQRQLLTIARALLADPEVLILDEATSSIDTRTERLVQKAMEQLSANRTSFVIAHRLSTIKNADLILVIREGDIVEQGTHRELLAAGGFYADLYNSQFSECDDALQ